METLPHELIHEIGYYLGDDIIHLIQGSKYYKNILDQEKIWQNLFLLEHENFIHTQSWKQLYFHYNDLHCLTIKGNLTLPYKRVKKILDYSDIVLVITSNGKLYIGKRTECGYQDKLFYENIKFKDALLFYEHIWYGTKFIQQYRVYALAENGDIYHIFNDSIYDKFVNFANVSKISKLSHSSDSIAIIIHNTLYIYRRSDLQLITKYPDVVDIDEHFYCTTSGQVYEHKTQILRNDVLVVDKYPETFIPNRYYWQRNPSNLYNPYVGKPLPNARLFLHYMQDIYYGINAQHKLYRFQQYEWKELSYLANDIQRSSHTYVIGMKL